MNKFIDEFYEAISFDDEPNFELLRPFFMDGAVCIETVNGKSRSKTINEHIDEMKEVFEKYPFLKSKGFKEKNVELKIIEHHPSYFVSSTYEKVYFNGKDLVESIGVNHFHITYINDEHKIISVNWIE